MTVVVVLLLFVVSAAVAATVVVRAQKRKFAEANVIVPGTTTKAPAEWAGAHTPEARLHDDLDIDSIDAIDLLVQLKPVAGKRRKRGVG